MYVQYSIYYVQMSVKKAKRDKRFEVRLNDEEWAKLSSFAESRGLSMAECVRDWIKNLPSTA